MGKLAKPRVGLIVGALSGTGGIFGAAARHRRLLADHVELVPISLEDSGEQTDWPGRLERVEDEFGPLWRVLAGDLRTDRMWLPEAGEAFLNHDVRQRTYADQIARIAQKEGLDALHVFGAFENRPLAAAFAAARLGLPLMISFRGADLEVRIFGNRLAQLNTALGAASAVVVNSRANQDLVTRLLRPACPVHLAPNHLEPGEFKSAEPVDLGIEGPVIGCLGEFRRLMGLDSLLKAFASLAVRRKVWLVLIGKFRRLELGYYSAFMERLGCLDRILRVGEVPHEKVLSYLAACDVAAFPSFSDASPNKVLEAMLAARPIVAGRVGGIPDLLRDGVDGLLVDPRDVDELAMALDRLLYDQDLARSLGQSARDRALDQFGADKALPPWLAAYREMVRC